MLARTYQFPTHEGVQQRAFGSSTTAVAATRPATRRVVQPADTSVLYLLLSLFCIFLGHQMLHQTCQGREGRGHRVGHAVLSTQKGNRTHRRPTRGLHSAAERHPPLNTSLAGNRHFVSIIRASGGSQTGPGHSQSHISVLLCC